MCDEMDEFKQKMTDFVDRIQQGLGEAVNAKPCRRTSVAAFCRLTEAERELHRQAAGNRLEEIANNWDLSRITEASNASRTRISTVSISGPMDRMSLVNMPASLETDPDVFDEDYGIDIANQSFHVSNSPVSSRPAGVKFEVEQAPHSISSAAGDQPLQVLVSPSATVTAAAASTTKSDDAISAASKADELTAAVTPAKAEQKPKSKVRRKAATSRRQPRLKKSEEVVSDTGSGDVEPAAAVIDRSVPQEADPTPGVSSGQTLRPRRKGVNYKDMVEDGSPVKKKPVKRSRKSPAVT
jgi:hypothetical protein